MVCNKLIQKAKPYFSKKCERARVWAAFCERTFGGIGKAKAASEVLQKMHPVRSQGALIVLQQPLLFSEGTHPLREGACRKKHISSEHAGVWAAFHERSYEGIATNANE